MSAVMDAGPGVGFAAAHAEVEVLLDAPLDLLSRDELLATWRELERLRNRLAAVEHRLVIEAEARGLPAEFGCRDAAALVRGLLRVHPREAVGRMRAADAACGRTTLTGEPTPAPFGVVAAAQAEGAISPRHAVVVVKAVEDLPDDVQAFHGAWLEDELVERAREFDPHELARLAQAHAIRLDPDGRLKDAAHRDRVRDLTVRQRPDGSASITGEATAELAERLLVVLDALAAPKPEADGVKDPRTAEQRRHHALLDALDLVQRAGLLPTTGGVSTTVVLTTSREEWDTGSGCVTTSHGAVMPVREAQRFTGGDARVMTVVLDPSGGVVDWTDARRVFTENQRLVMAARDGAHCSFPGCDAPLAWTQAHHLRDYADGGTTTVDDGTLVCGHHHRQALARGWRADLIDGRAAWIPPPWIDPHRTPRTNHSPQPEAPP